MKIRPFSKPRSASKTVLDQRLHGDQRSQKGQGSSFPEERGSCADASQGSEHGQGRYGSVLWPERGVEESRRQEVWVCDAISDYGR